MLAQRAVADSPRWTRAVEDHSGPIPEREQGSSEGSYISFDACTLEPIQATLFKSVTSNLGGSIAVEIHVVMNHLTSLVGRRAIGEIMLEL